ncbi:ubiquitin-conjugating enzyme/RWD-like protein [Zopfochytrium polystomum]|nr:ubiquitin-conjugating enzyme/RWD-like protein [Zopfochytrium polystomum]
MCPLGQNNSNLEVTCHRKKINLTKTEMASRSAAVKRLMKEYADLKKEPSPEFIAAPLEDNIFEWHFTVRGPAEGGFAGGRYHGRIIFPSDYPFKPPNIVFLTPNGRFEVNKKICLSITGFHPEYWRPAWGVRSALVALISFMTSEGNGAIGAIDYTAEERARLAKASRAWVCRDCGSVNSQVLPDESVVASTVLKGEDGIQFGVPQPQQPRAGEEKEADETVATPKNVLAVSSTVSSLKKAEVEADDVDSSKSNSENDAKPPPQMQSGLRQRNQLRDVGGTAQGLPVAAPAQPENSPTALSDQSVPEQVVAEGVVTPNVVESRRRQIDTLIVFLVFLLGYLVLRRVSLLIAKPVH